MPTAIDFSVGNITEILNGIPCPKCGEVGWLRKHSHNKLTGIWRVQCHKCGGTTSERLLDQPVSSPVKVERGSNNNPSIAQLQDDVNDLKKMLAQLLGAKAIDIKPEPTTFNWDDYSEDQQIKIQQLIGILREHPKWGSYKLQKELQRLKMGIRMGDIIKVKNAFGKGVFNENKATG